MAKKSLSEIKDIKGKKALVRVDFNVPLDATGNISNDRRIRAALPTLRRILECGGAVIVMSHLGRPKGDAKKDISFRMTRVAERLSQLLGKPVLKVDQVVGPEVASAAGSLQPGQILVLENLRFHPGEQAGDPAFAEQLGKLADIYVNDAFGTCHRRDASMLAVPAAMKDKPRVVGFLVARELEVLDKLLTAPDRPFIGILGGAKVSDKIGLIESLLKRVDKLLIGGAMTYTFLKAQGEGIGSSRCEMDKLEVAHDLLRQGDQKIMLPRDHLIADKPEAGAQTRIIEGSIPDGWFGMDIGPKTIKLYREEIGKAGTAVWNGPMGKFEDVSFSQGTRAIALALAQAKGVTIVGGGETAEAVEQFGLDERMRHVSTGGGAFLEYVEGASFPALAQIDDDR